ncbi:hypothetical protein AMECASPLE_016237 [Ameca splendens]|uniref:Ig-like domain-containing protein n=1 Tax=Ameca splendens TaxID=208324 RepID=A0ABV0XF91_9TELE
MEMTGHILTHLLCLVCLCSAHPQPAARIPSSLHAAGSLGGRVVLTCNLPMMLASPSSTADSTTHRPLPDEPVRIQWLKLDKQEEKLVLVAQGGVMKVGLEFMGRVSVPGHLLSLKDASLTIMRLRVSDAALYLCKVTHGLEETQSIVSLSVSGT